MATERTYQSASAGSAAPVAPYTYGAPSPPTIPIPVATWSSRDPSMTLLPSYKNADPTQLTSRDIGIIIQDEKFVATEKGADWVYEQRREAQMITKFLYVGPNSVARNHAYLQREGITMILVARDPRHPTKRLPSVDKAAEALGIRAGYVDVDGVSQLIQTFPLAVEAINNHLLEVYHDQAQDRTQDGDMVVEPASFKRGKVLVTCETGNERSPTIVAAYMMAVLGTNLASTVHFICSQRFCCCFDEEVKRKLQSWEDILRARSQVAAAQAQLNGAGPSKTKRHFEETMDDEDVDTEAKMDMDRFQGRDTFSPFLDASTQCEF